MKSREQAAFLTLIYEPFTGSLQKFLALPCHFLGLRALSDRNQQDKLTVFMATMFVYLSLRGERTASCRVSLKVSSKLLNKPKLFSLGTSLVDELYKKVRLRQPFCCVATKCCFPVTLRERVTSRKLPGKLSGKITG